MIKSNMMPAQSKSLDLNIKSKAGKKSVAKKKSGGGKFFKRLFALLLLSVMGGAVYVEYYGVPKELYDIIPPEIMQMLGFSEENPAAPVAREASGPKLTAQGRKTDDPSIPINGSVEEVVKTVRPEIYFKERVISEYKEQPVNNRIAYQKQAFHIMLSTFYNVTPDGIGYLDLAYQAPNFFFARAIALDSRTRTTYMDNLNIRVTDLTMTDTVTATDGSVEFVVYGGIQQPKFDELTLTKLVQPSRINAEILALRNLAILHHVRLSGVEKPMEERVGNYRRIIITSSTDADYPSLLNFADALQKSDISFGVQQFVSRPAGPEKMQSSLEFVMYAAMK